MRKKTNSPIVVASGEAEDEMVDAFLEEAEEIVKLSKLRDTLSLSTKTTLRNKAEAALTKAITERVNSLSASIVQHFNHQSGESDD